MHALEVDVSGSVTELRLVLTVRDYPAAEAFYRNVLGMEVAAQFPSPGRVVLFEAGRATIELADEAHAEHVDQVEVGRRVAGAVRVALRVPDVEAATATAVATGAVDVLSLPVRTPWGSLNSRLTAPGGTQLTLFGPDA